MEHEILSKDLIPQPELWRCAIVIERSRLDVALFPPVESERLIHRTILLNRDASSHTKAVQEAVYANPLLLSDFTRIDVLTDTGDFCIVPRETARSVDAGEILATAKADLTGKSAEIAHATEHISVAFALDTPLAGFIRRTFFNVHLSHILAPVIANPPADTALFAECSQEKVLVTATAGGKLIFANIFHCDCPEDATYFITAVSRSLPEKNLPVILTGNAPYTDTVREYLTRYVDEPHRYDVNPALARLGEDSLTLPQPLTALLSCE
ncbi:MAG: DUF3822 family protein [Paramuribaculum sp.]|nr:DUF3822 family protein [Paramuribaculum sp.]